MTVTMKMMELVIGGSLQSNTHFSLASMYRMPSPVTGHEDTQLNTRLTFPSYACLVAA